MWCELAAVAILPAVVLCFTHQDNELFRLREKIRQDLGDETTFYSWLGLKKGASVKAISKAFRKLSIALHPDRNPGQEATERFARLNQVNKVLRSPLRERYDYYMSVGFPLYNKDTDTFYYKRYRPSLILVFLLLSLVYTGLQFLYLKSTATRNRQRLETFVRDAKEEAANASRNGVVTSITKIHVNNRPFTVHPTGEVYFEGQLVTPESVPEPTIYDTHAAKLFTVLRQKLSGEQPAAPVQAATVEKVAEPVEVEEESKVATKGKKTVEPLKKGAARRRPAGAGGKARIFG